jgi:hypothetical protein
VAGQPGGTAPHPAQCRRRHQSDPAAAGAAPVQLVQAARQLGGASWGAPAHLEVAVGEVDARDDLARALHSSPHALGSLVVPVPGAEVARGVRRDRLLDHQQRFRLAHRGGRRRAGRRRAGRRRRAGGADAGVCEQRGRRGAWDHCAGSAGCLSMLCQPLEVGLAPSLRPPASRPTCNADGLCPVGKRHGAADAGVAVQHQSGQPAHPARPLAGHWPLQPVALQVDP